jgi:hypothetical protein
MPTYLIEPYLPRAGSLAEDETCFHVFEAPIRDAVVAAAAHAGLADARITEALRNEKAPTPERRVP